GLDRHPPGLHGDGADDPGPTHQSLQLGRQVVAPQDALLGRHPRVLGRVVAPEVLVGVDDGQRRAHAPGPPGSVSVNVVAGSVPPYAHCTFVTGSRPAWTRATTAGSAGSLSHARP